MGEEIEPKLLEALTKFRDDLVEAWGPRYDQEVGESRHLLCFMSIVGKTLVEVQGLWEDLDKRYPEQARQVAEHMLIQELTNQYFHNRRN